jgi:hypothetical protein
LQRKRHLFPVREKAMKHRIIHKSIRCKLFPHICRKSRSEVIEDIGRALPYLNNQDMMELSNKILGKLALQGFIKYYGLSWI